MGAITPNKTLPLASVPVELPGFGSPVSQGLSGGALQHKVQPAYPVQALPLRLSGTVILQATIGESGKVDDLKVVSGPPILTAAAMDAVRQWRYSPFLLDGKPVKMQKQVTISFQAP
jgi:protein TonB